MGNIKLITPHIAHKHSIRRIKTLTVFITSLKNPSNRIVYRLLGIVIKKE
jgi:hypothetical protein